MLQEFFAVTRSRSLYRVTCNSEGRCPTAQNMDRSDLAFNKGVFLGVSIGPNDFNQGLVEVPILSDKYGRQWWRMNKAYHGHSTTSVMALFLAEEDARRCQERARRMSDEEVLSCFARATLDALAAITDEHPCFLVAPHEPLTPVSTS